MAYGGGLGEACSFKGNIHQKINYFHRHKLIIIMMMMDHSIQDCLILDGHLFAAVMGICEKVFFVRLGCYFHLIKNLVLLS